MITLIDLWHAIVNWITAHQVTQWVEGLVAGYLALDSLRKVIKIFREVPVGAFAKDLMARTLALALALIRDRIGPFPDRQLQMPSEPPRLAEFLVGLLAKKRYRNSILRDLAEDFDSNLVSGMSLDRANRCYWAAAINSIVPQALAALKRIGVLGLVFDYARRWMG
jgi:hypothetical protein